MVDTRDEISRDYAGERTYDVLPRDLGTYLVTTSTGTTYLFELGRRTVTRTPHSEAAPGLNDGARTLRSIERCEVGASGHWTMIAGDPSTDFYWQVTSPIVSIVAAASPAPSTLNRDGGRQR